MNVSQITIDAPNTANDSLDHRSVLENDNDRDDHNQVGVLSTVCGYMSGDGFTIVQHKYKKKVSQDKEKSNGHRAKRLSKRKETAKANEGNDQKRSRKHSVMMSMAHYI
jgi:phage/plasmid primase-like uncharacterized protein